MGVCFELEEFLRGSRQATGKHGKEQEEFNLLVEGLASKVGTLELDA